MASVHFNIKDLREFSNFGEVPEFVKESQEITTEEVKQLPGTSFADAGRELPTHTKAATWMSALKYEKAGENSWDQKTQENLEKAAKFWGIEPTLWDLSKTVKMAQAIPELDDSHFAVVVKDGDDLIERRWPLSDGSSVKKAAAGLYENRDRYPLGIRKVAASKILKRAMDLGVNLEDDQDYIEKAAGYGIAKAGELNAALRTRRYLSKSAAVRERYMEQERKLADNVDSDDDFVSGEILEKFASFIDEADREEKMYRAYNKGMATPEELCFSRSVTSLEKAASAGRLRDGTPFDFDKLAGVSAEQFSALGDDFVSAIADGDGKVDLEKAAAIIPTLPMDDTSLFKRSITL